MRELIMNKSYVNKTFFTYGHVFSHENILFIRFEEVRQLYGFLELGRGHSF